MMLATFLGCQRRWLLFAASFDSKVAQRLAGSAPKCLGTFIYQPKSVNLLTGQHFFTNESKRIPRRFSCVKMAIHSIAHLSAECSKVLLR